MRYTKTVDVVTVVCIPFERTFNERRLQHLDSGANYGHWRRDICRLFLLDSDKTGFYGMAIDLPVSSFTAQGIVSLLELCVWYIIIGQINFFSVWCVHNESKHHRLCGGEITLDCTVT